MNPYHDEKGRFASANGGEKVESKEYSIAEIARGDKVESIERRIANTKETIATCQQREKDGETIKKLRKDLYRENQNLKRAKRTQEKAKIAAEFTKTDPATFSESIAEAKKTVPENRRWRVTNYDAEHYKDTKLYVTNGGSTLAVTKDGTIISVCVHADDKKSGKINGRDLIEKAIKIGGCKGDSLDGNYGFYRKCGLEPVSWCKFDERFAPDDWKKEYGEEDIIFFKYTGNKKILNRVAAHKELKAFKERVKASKDYDAAEKALNESFERS